MKCFSPVMEHNEVGRFQAGNLQYKFCAVLACPSTCPSSWAPGRSVLGRSGREGDGVQVCWVVPWTTLCWWPPMPGFSFEDPSSMQASYSASWPYCTIGRRGYVVKETPLAVHALCRLTSPTPQSARLLHSETVNGLDVSDSLQNRPALCLIAAVV